MNPDAIKPAAWAMPRQDGMVLDVISHEEHERLEGRYTAPLYGRDVAEDAERFRWIVRHASLGFDGAPSWNAVVRLPVFDSEDQTITAIVDRARRGSRSDEA
jgi:hypothetical protein